MKKIIIMIMCIFLLSACNVENKENTNIITEVYVEGIIIEINDNTINIEVSDVASSKFNKGDVVTININESTIKPSSLEELDTIEVVYMSDKYTEKEILESNSITLIEKNAEDFIATIMINDELYYQTIIPVQDDNLINHDGEITNVINNKEIPTNNNEANFGVVGMKYYFASIEGMIYVEMNDGFITFATQSTIDNLMMRPR